MNIDNNMERKYCNIQDIQKIDNNVKKIYSKTISDEIKYTNKLERIYEDDPGLYIAYLFLKYCDYICADPNEAIDYIIKNNLKDYQLLLAHNPEVLKFIELINKARPFYMNHLYTKLNVDFNSEKLIEINKGQYDTCITPNNTSISIYNSSINQPDSALFREEEFLYGAFETEGISELEEGCTFLLHNPSNILEVFKVLQTLAGTNNRLIISEWGFTTENKTKKACLVNFREVLVLLKTIGKDSIIQSKSEDNENLFCESIVIDTKRIKQVVDSKSLLTEKELHIIKNALKISKGVRYVK